MVYDPTDPDRGSAGDNIRQNMLLSPMVGEISNCIIHIHIYSWLSVDCAPEYAEVLVSEAGLLILPLG